MKNRFSALLFSVKSSISNKPMALLLLMLIIVLTIIIIGSFGKILISDAEYNMYSSAKLEANSENIDIVEYGDTIKALRNSGFITSDDDCIMTSSFFKVDIKNLENVNEFVYSLERGNIVYIVYANEYYTEELLNSGKKGVVISRNLADKVGAEVGGRINISNVAGNEYEILAVENYEAPDAIGGEPAIFLPYFAPLNVAYKSGGRFEKNDFGTPEITVHDLSRMPTKQERAAANASGLVILTNPAINASGILMCILIFPLAAYFVFNILYILNYIDKVNAKKYTVMKLVGAKPSFLIWATYLEVMLVALIGMGIGMGIEDAIFKSMTGLVIDKLLWVGYVFEAAITVLTVFIATTVRVLIRGRSARIDRRSL